MRKQSVTQMNMTSENKMSPHDQVHQNLMTHTYGNSANIMTPAIMLPSLKNRTVVSKGYKRNVNIHDGSRSN